MSEFEFQPTGYSLGAIHDAAYDLGYDQMLERVKEKWGNVEEGNWNFEDFAYWLNEQLPRRKK